MYPTARWIVYLKRKKGFTMINHLIEFEGYRARIERARDGMLYGRVLGLEEIVNFKAPTMRVVERQFIKALEGYFERCKQRGEEPVKPAEMGL